uniref:Alcohol dehydrogenase N-terminal domain-containing protein n=1 Tax=Loxodonta africana TaxID=9785 RepID=G3TZW9_LOXAF
FSLCPLTITCRAALAWALNSPLSVEEVQAHPPKAGEVHIKMVSSGICGTDNHILKGRLSVSFPLIPGHEGAGIVESIGEGVSSMKSGDKVLTLILPQPRECNPSLHTVGNFCQKQDVLPSFALTLDRTSRFTCKGEKIYHSFRTSTFTEYTIVPEIAVAKIDDAAPMDKVCIISCENPRGYGAAAHSAKVTPGSTRVAYGLGRIGSVIVIGCKASGTSNVIEVDINEKKFPWAKALGVTDCLSPKLKKPVQEVMVEMTRFGVDFVFEAIGLTDMWVAAWDSCPESYGFCMIIGLASSNSKLSLGALMIFSGRTLKGASLGDYKTRDCIPQLVTAYNGINIDPLITHELPFNQIHKVMELFYAGKSFSIHCVLLF